MGTVLKELRETKGYSILEVSRGTGLSRQQLYSIEAGVYSPTIRNLKLITDFLGIKLSDFFSLVEAQTGE